MLKLCLMGLIHRKVRTLLIALSIAVGVFSVLIIGIISDNGVIFINDEMEVLGLSGVSVTKVSQNRSDVLDGEDLKAIKKQSYVKNATPIITATGYLKCDELSSGLMCGVDENAKSVIDVETISGEKISNSHIIEKAAVCSIDEKTAMAVFGKASPLGEALEVFIEGKTYSLTVIGTVKASSGLLQGSLGDLLPCIIYMPYTTLQEVLKTKSFNQIAVDFKPDFSNEFCIENIKTAISRGSSENIIKVEDLNKQRDSLNDILNIITFVLKLIGGVSLIVSGLGIMTVMLISVKEKTKEIGIKKSIGACNFKIMLEFLFEAGLISLIGSVFGVVACYSVAVTASFVFNIDPVIQFNNLLPTIAAALFCGISFGVFPALKAANLKPIDALRSE